MNTNEQTSLVPVKRGLPSLRTRALAVADKGIRSLDVFRRHPAVSRAAAVGLGIGAGWQLSRVVRATQLDRPLVNLLRSVASGRNASTEPGSRSYGDSSCLSHRQGLRRSETDPD